MPGLFTCPMNGGAGAACGAGKAAARFFSIAGKGLANPAGAIVSAALRVRHHWARPEAADRLERSVYAALGAGARTPDLGGTATTRSVTDAVLGELGDGG